MTSPATTAATTALTPPVVVIGIDFGTTFSGVSFMKYDQAHVDIFETNVALKVGHIWAWPDQGTHPHYPKTITALFYEPDKPVLWGWSAWLAAIQRKDKGTFVQRFKLHLAGMKDRERAIQLCQLPAGKSAIDLTADFLREIGGYACLKAKEHFRLPSLSFREIQFCLTVPAMWDQSARMATRVAAQRAGLIYDATALVDNLGSKHPFTLALEPEAASIYVSTIDKASRPAQNEPYLIVDCGGGTVDLVAHSPFYNETTKQLKFSELLPSSGGLCGGAFVDECFLAFLPGFVGQDALTKLMEPKHIEQYLRLLKNWEELKRAFTGEEEDELALELPKILRKGYMEQHPDEDEHDDLGLSPTDLGNTYQASVAKTVELMQQMLTNPKLGDCKMVYLVGGLAASTYFSSQIKALFPAHKIVVPSHPSAAVLVGATLIGHFPNLLISHRCMPMTYGLEVSRPTQPHHPPWLERVTFNGKQYTVGMFQAFVKKGDIVPQDHRVRMDFGFCGRATCIATLYQTRAPDAVTVNDPGVEKIGEVHVSLTEHSEFFTGGSLHVDFLLARELLEIWVWSHDEKMVIRQSFTPPQVS